MWNAFVKRRTAGLAPRSLALLIDGLLLMALAAPLLWLAHGEPVARWSDTRALSLACNWLLPALYFAGFWAWQGTTPGKAAAGLRVIDTATGGRPTLARSLLRWLGYLVSALPLGAGFAWARFDAAGLAWHDRLAGTRVVHHREPDDAAQVDAYLIRHWRGEQSLARSFWVNNVLLSLPLTYALGGLMGWIEMQGDSLRAAAIAVLVGWPLALVCNAWCVVGGWRAAGRYLHEGGARLWGWLARLSMGLGVLQIGASALFGFLPSAGEYLLLARGIDPIGQASLTLSPDGHALQLRGPIGLGDAARLAELAATAPALRVVELDSPGGRLAEAERIVALLKARGAITTRAVANCESACTLVFLAGAQRQLMPGAQLGFHRASSGSFNPVLDEIATQHLLGLYRGLGLPQDYIEHAARTPPRSMWYPTAEDLAAHELIAPPLRTLDVTLPPPAAAVAEYEDALRANPAWYRLDTREPGTIAGAAVLMRTARAAGDDASQAASLLALTTTVPALIVGSRPELRRRYIELLTAQMRADPARCQALLAGGIAAHRELDPRTLAAESAWLIEAADAPAPRRAPKAAPSAVELEVLHRSLRLPVQGLLAGVWNEAPVARAVSCDKALAALARVAALPAAQRELAERVLFQSPG